MSRTSAARNALAGLAAAGALVLLTAAPPASAGAPTRIEETSLSIACEGTGAGFHVTVSVTRSDLGGTTAAAQVADPTGETLRRGEATSDWTAETFRAAIPLEDNGGQPAGQVYVAGRYAVAGEPNPPGRGSGSATCASSRSTRSPPLPPPT